MTSATIRVVGLNTPEVANKLLWWFEDAFKRNEDLVKYKKGFRSHVRKTKTSGNAKN